MELRDYLRILHKNWALILILTILGGSAGALMSFLTTPLYQSTTQLYVSVRNEGAGGSGELVQGTSFARQVVASYVDIVNTDLVLGPVIDELGLDRTPGQLATQMASSAPVNTALINITVTDPDPELAANIANAAAASFTTAVSEYLEKPEGDAPSLVQLRTVQTAQVPVRPASPNIPLNIVLGTLVGLAAGIGVAALRTVLDTRIHSSHDIENVTDAPLLGGIALDPDAKKRPLIVHADPRNPRAESFRTLRTNLQFLNIEGGPRSFVVSSAGPGEGKSTTTANLAISLAETGAKVALIDGDLRLPKLAEYLSIEGAVGLTDVLIGRAELADVLQRWGKNQLFVLPAGRIPPNPSELLGSRAMDVLLKTLAEHVDFILIDAPPLLLVTDAAVVSKKTSGTILIAASGSTKKQELAGAVRTLETVGARLLGVIVTKLPTRGPDSYSYGTYSYGYGHDVPLMADTGAIPVKQGRRARRATR